MVILYIYSTYWHMKSMFYERQHIPKLKLLLVLEQSQTWSNARNSRQHKCRPLFKLSKRINVAIPCGPYLPHGAFVSFFNLSWAVERWNISSVSLLLSLFLKSIRENMITMILWFLKIRHSDTLFSMWFLTLAQQIFLFILPSRGFMCANTGRSWGFVQAMITSSHWIRINGCDQLGCQANNRLCGNGSDNLGLLCTT
jgi:hypothetical protein